MHARLLVVLALLGSGGAWAGPAPVAAAGDRDGDGLSDFDEVHKYRTDPAQADSDGDGTPDGEADERREFTYSIRCRVEHLPPAEAVTDLWQDAREVRRDADGVELEITAYPLAEPGGGEPAPPGSGARGDGLEAYLRPNLTADFDAAMQADLRAALAQDGLDTSRPLSAADVPRAASWALRRMHANATGFTSYFVEARDGRLAVVPGLERPFQDAKSDASRSLEQQLDLEVRGRSMYAQATCGSCTSTGIFLETVLRALGVPTRSTVAMPAADGNDPAQGERLAQALRPSALRDAILAGAAAARGWTEHTFNEVFADGRWRRLNYTRLDPPVVDRDYLGLMLRILTYDDHATSGTAATWGRKYGLGLRSGRFPTSNPYRLLAASDLLGPHARVTLPPPAPPAARPDAPRGS